MLMRLAWDTLLLLECPHTAREVEHPTVTSIVKFKQIRVDVTVDPGHEDALIELAVGLVHGGGAGGIRQEYPGLEEDSGSLVEKELPPCCTERQHCWLCCPESR